MVFLFMLIILLFMKTVYTNIAYTIKRICFAFHSLILINSEKKLEEAEKHLGMKQAAQLAVQMQPRFIFNALSYIEFLCQTDPQAAVESVENLAGYLRGNMDDFLIPRSIAARLSAGFQ